MVEMIKLDDGDYVPKEHCTFTNPLTSGGKSEVDDVELPCGEDCGYECSKCVIQKLMNEYAVLEDQTSRAKTLIENLAELVRQNRQDIYNQEFAEYLMKETEITQEELTAFGVFGEEAHND